MKKRINIIIKEQGTAPALYTLISKDGNSYHVISEKTEQIVPFEKIEYICVGYKYILKRILKPPRKNKTSK